MPNTLRSPPITRPQRRPPGLSPDCGPVSESPKDIDPGHASWADRQQRPLNSEDVDERAEALHDEALELSFPASDPCAEPPAKAAPFCPDQEERLLDAAIAMTFPASDPVAFTPLHKPDR